MAKSSPTSSKDHEKFLDDLQVTSEGVRQNQHGDLFQLNILMYALWKASHADFDHFRLATELPEAEKFDDVVFQYRNSDQERYKLRLFQLKHKEGLRVDSIGRGDLLTMESKGAFALFKYFLSLFEIERRCNGNSMYSLIRNGVVEDVCLITNAGFASDEKSLTENFFENNEILQNDKLLGLSDANEAVCYVIKEESDLAQELIHILEATSDFSKLVSSLTSDIIATKITKSTNLVKSYLYGLKNHVFVVEEVSSSYFLKFSKRFLEDEDLHEDTKIFRHTLLKEIKFLQDWGQTKKNTSQRTIATPKKLIEFVDTLAHLILKPDSIQKKEEENWRFTNDHIFDLNSRKFYEAFFKGESIGATLLKFRRCLIDKIVTIENVESFKNMKSQISKDIASKFYLESLAELHDPEKFAQQLFDMLEDTTFKIYLPNGSEKDKEIFTENIKILGQSQVIVKVFFEIRFSSNFLSNTSFADFRRNLISLLNIQDSQDLGKYTFEVHIKSFYCSEEDSLQMSLPVTYKPDDFSNFFKKFKLIFKYPNRFKINETLKNQMQKQFRNLNSEAFNAVYQKNMLNWMSERLGTFYTPEKVNHLFEVVNQSLHCWVMEGINKSHIANVPMNFIFEPVRNLLKFLENDEQISCMLFEDNFLGRIRLYQTIRFLRTQNKLKYQKYIDTFGYIFFSADKLKNSDLKEPFEKALLDNELWNLLIMEWDLDDSCENFQWVFDWVQDKILGSEHKRKIIFIAKTECQNMKNITQNLEHIETKFNELTKRSQDLFLEEQCFDLQGSNLRLGDLISETQKDIVDAETMVKVFLKQKVKIGGTLHLSNSYDSELYVDCAPKGYKNEEDFIEKCRQHIISDSAGRGKSTFLSRLSNKIKTNFPNVWVVHVEFTYYSRLLSEESNRKKKGRPMLKKSDKRSAIKFLLLLLNCKKESKLKTDFEGKLLKKALEEGCRFKVALLFDGFDEISPFYEDVCLDFLSGLKLACAEWLIVTTRPCLEESLKSCLNYVASNLYPFKGETQCEYITKLLRRELLGKCSRPCLDTIGAIKSERLSIIFSYPSEIKEPRFDRNVLVSYFDMKIIDLTSCLTFINSVDEILDQEAPEWRKRFLCKLIAISNEEYVDIDDNYTCFVIGFDRIDYKSQNIVIDFFKEIPSTGSKIILLSKQSLHDKLKPDFKQIYITEKIKFADEFSAEEIDPINPFTFDMKLYSFVRKLVSELEKLRTYDRFLETPLFLKLLSGSHIEHCFNFITKNSEEPIFTTDLSRFDIYCSFVEKMHYNFYYDKRQQDPTNVTAKMEEENSLKSFIKRHKKLAIYALADRQEILEVCLRLFEENEKQVESGEVKGGLVVKIVDHKPIFLHRTFAEYFVADFIGDVLSSQHECSDFCELISRDLLEQKIFSTDLYEFLDELLRKKRSPIQQKILQQLKFPLYEQTQTNEWWFKEGTNIMPLCNGNLGIVRLIFDSVKLQDNSFPDEKLFWDCLIDYAKKKFGCDRDMYYFFQEFILSWNKISKNFHTDFRRKFSLDGYGWNENKEECLKTIKLGQPFDLPLAVKCFKELYVHTCRNEARLIFYLCREFSKGSVRLHNYLATNKEKKILICISEPSGEISIPARFIMQGEKIYFEFTQEGLNDQK